MDDEFGVEKVWELSNLLKRAQPIQRKSVNDNLATETIKNLTKGKSTKVKMKSVKEKMKLVKKKIKPNKGKIKSVKEKSKLAMEIEDCSGW